MKDLSTERSLNMPVLVPAGDDLVVRDWRDGRETRHVYPTRGCHGQPLTRPCPELHEEEGAYCHRCRGTGVVRPQRGWDTTACG